MLIQNPVLVGIQYSSKKQRIFRREYIFPQERMPGDSFRTQRLLPLKPGRRRSIYSHTNFPPGVPVNGQGSARAAIIAHQSEGIQEIISGTIIHLTKFTPLQS